MNVLRSTNEIHKQKMEGMQQKMELMEPYYFHYLFDLYKKYWECERGTWCLQIQDNGPKKNHNFAIYNKFFLKFWGNIIGEGLIVKMCN